jgi:hypothetical protein
MTNLLLTLPQLLRVVQAEVAIDDPRHGSRQVRPDAFASAVKVVPDQKMDPLDTFQKYFMRGFAL